MFIYVETCTIHIVMGFLWNPPAINIWIKYILKTRFRGDEKEQNKLENFWKWRYSKISFTKYCNNTEYKKICAIVHYVAGFYISSSKNFDSLARSQSFFSTCYLFSNTWKYGKKCGNSSESNSQDDESEINTLFKPSNSEGCK
jgi:hypothetical protein